MWLVFLILIFTVGVFHSKIEINVYKLQFLEKNLEGELKVFWKLFRVISIPIIVICNQKVKIFGKDVSYRKLLFSKGKYRLTRKTFQELKYKIQWNYAFFTLKIGVVDVTLTNIVIIILSSIIPIVLKGKNEYRIFPEYNKLCVELSGKITMSLKFWDVCKWYWKNIKQKVAHNKTKKDKVKESFINE